MGNLYDIHGHFLPGMDDGCKTPEESLEVLRQAYGQGVQVMFATPHYYHTEPISTFLARRQQAVERLQAYCADHPDIRTPEIYLGAEVACKPGISSDPDLEKLCLGGTEYLLLELPWSGWGSETVREVNRICHVSSLTPVLAHLERYVTAVPWKQIETILEMGVLVQVNAEAFTCFSGRQAANKILRRSGIDLIGSDCHNLTTRTPNLDQAVNYMLRHNMTGLLDHICDLSETICEQVTQEDKVRL